MSHIVTFYVMFCIKATTLQKPSAAILLNFLIIKISTSWFEWSQWLKCHIASLSYRKYVLYPMSCIIDILLLCCMINCQIISTIWILSPACDLMRLSNFLYTTEILKYHNMFLFLDTSGSKCIVTYKQQFHWLLYLIEIM